MRLSPIFTKSRSSQFTLKGEKVMTIAVTKETLLKRARLYPDVIRLPLDDARVCLNCDTIHNGDTCPVCASATSLFLSSVIGRLPQNRYFEKEATHAEVHGKPPITTRNEWQLKSVVGAGR